MAVPRNRHSRARTKSKRATQAKTAKSGVTCPNCKAEHVPHVVCSDCGYYGGRIAIVKEKE